MIESKGGIRSGTNGLTSALTLARSGVSVHVIEAAEDLGGGIHSGEATLPGLIHDSCSAFHP
nr:NAD(P)-binding protein [Austwickia chelonae]